MGGPSLGRPWAGLGMPAVDLGRGVDLRRGVDLGRGVGGCLGMLDAWGWMPGGGQPWAVGCKSLDIWPVKLYTECATIDQQSNQHERGK